VSTNFSIHTEDFYFYRPDFGPSRRGQQCKNREYNARVLHGFSLLRVMLKKQVAEIDSEPNSLFREQSTKGLEDWELRTKAHGVVVKDT
jgi:hypothetical protein